VIGIAADEKSLSTTAGQHIAATAALLCARSGATIRLFLPETKLVGVQPPLRGQVFSFALEDCVADVCDGASRSGDLDILFVIGGPSKLPSAELTLWLGATDWSGVIEAEGLQAEWTSWANVRLPFGALAAAGLGAAEALKLAHRRVSHLAANPTLFGEYYQPQMSGQVTLSHASIPAGPLSIDSVDAISGGAIIQNALYAITRVPDISGRLRVIEPERSDVTNLNRYSFLRRSDVGGSKANLLTRPDIAGTLIVESIEMRYEPRTLQSLGALRPRVLVGVDDIPTRWLVQGQWPSWLGVGATSHYDAMSSFHRPTSAGCAGCAHPTDDDGAGVLPTAAVISHWAGLLLATQLIREAVGHPYDDSEQLVYCHPLRVSTKNGMFRSVVTRHPHCPVHSTNPSERPRVFRSVLRHS
jgi:hypothetical protein